MEYGYARCSTNETKQDIDRQVRELKAAGAREIFLEYEHGDAKVKSQQEALFATAEAGDTIITLEVPRLARSTQQLCGIIDTVREKRLRLVIVGSITLDCREGKADPMSEAFLQMAGVFSQLELAMIRSRVRSGMANAKAKGKQIGRPQITADSIPAIFLRHYPAFKNGQLNVSELARVCDLSRTTIYKYISLLEA
ncbi:MAG: recombinase family protein [Faecousia sp.]